MVKNKYIYISEFQYWLGYKTNLLVNKTHILYGILYRFQ